MNESANVNFIAKLTFKNGSYKLHFIESELYEILRLLGYRFVRIKREPFMYHVDVVSRIRLIRHFHELRDAFADYIKQLDLPVKERDEILNLFYAKRPIKRNFSIE